MKNNIKKTNGFTLVELMVSMTLFSAVVVIAMGALMMVLDSSRKAKTIKTIVNNLHVAVEGMSREIRVGYDYTCGANTFGTGSEIISGGKDSGVGCSDEEKIGFHTKKTDGWAFYKLEDNTIKRWLNESSAPGGGRDDGGWLNITTDAITIDHLDFMVVGTASGSGDYIQPRVMIRIGGSAKVEKFSSDFDIQTTVSQRLLAP